MQCFGRKWAQCGQGSAAGGAMRCAQAGSTIQAPRTRSAFTIIELLVAIGIIGLLLALLIPAVQMAREAARRTNCFSNLRQISVATAAYTDAHGWLPAGSRNGFSLFVRILPEFGQAPLFNQIDFAIEQGVDNDRHAFLRKVILPLLRCPSDGYQSDRSSPSNYGGNAGLGVQCGGYSGPFRLPRGTSTPEFQAIALRIAEITDGLSTTAAYSEMLVGDRTGARLRTAWILPDQLQECRQLDEFANNCRNVDPTGQKGDLTLRGEWWAWGDNGVTIYNHILTPNQPSCLSTGWNPGGCYPATSNHPGGAALAMCDGSVRFASDTVDMSVWRAIATRNGSEAAAGEW